MLEELVLVIAIGYQKIRIFIGVTSIVKVVCSNSFAMIICLAYAKSAYKGNTAQATNTAGNTHIERFITIITSNHCLFH